MSNLPYWLAALYLHNIGPRTIKRWLENFPDIKSIFSASQDELQEKGIAEPHREILKSPNWKQVEKDLAWINQNDHHIISIDDESYPYLLKEIFDPPIVLFIRGNKEALSQKQIAIVGARSATPHGIKNAEIFGHDLATAGYAVTSGLALGIDGASHRGALSAKGITIAVCGSGLNHVYPKSHRPLANQIINNNGAVISEFPLEVEPRAENFPRRNRVIGGMSKGVLVVEAAVKSGSLITARHALEQGREVFAIPGSIHNPLSRGCHHLIREGAKLVESTKDILEEFADQTSFLPVRQTRSDKELPVLQRRVLSEIGYEITPIDMILLRTRLTAGEVSSMLLILELNGYIQSVAGGYIREIP